MNELRGVHPRVVKPTFGQLHIGADVPHDVFGGRRVPEDVGGRLAQAGEEPVAVQPGVGVGESAQAQFGEAEDLLPREFRFANILHLRKCQVRRR